MSKGRRRLPPVPFQDPVKSLDPTESGPPEAEQLAGVTTLAESPGLLLVPIDDDGHAEQPGPESIVPETPAGRSAPPAAPDFTTIVADCDRQSAPGWPTESPFRVDWPWGGEPDPVPGDIVGWNWRQNKIAVVTAVPPVTSRWPYTLTVELRPMPAERSPALLQIFDLQSGRKREHLAWYTRWNRVYLYAKTFDADGHGRQEAVWQLASGWLAVVGEKA